MPQNMTNFPIPAAGRFFGLGTEAANHAAEIKLRAQRKAGELLAQLERKQTSGLKRGPSVQAGATESDYRAMLEEEEIAPTTAHRWQQVAKIEPEVFEKKIAETLESGGELTAATFELRKCLKIGTFDNLTAQMRSW